MKKIVSLLIFFVFISSCESDGKTQTIEVDNEYTINLPNFLSKTDTISEVAILQYQNTKKKIYTLIIADTKTEFADVIGTNIILDKVYKNDLTDLNNQYLINIDGYSNFILDFITKKGISINTISSLEKTTINGLNARIISITGKAHIDNTFYYWKFAFIESKDNFYQVITWTLKNQKNKYNQQMDSIIQSFRKKTKT